MIDFSNVKNIVIPEGEVAVITYNGEILWKKSRLPLEYQEVEYLESTGTQYIDTGIIAKSGIEVYLDYEFVTITSTSTILCGATNNNGGNRLYIAHSKGLFGYGNAYSTSHSIDVGIRYDMYAKLYKGEQRIVVNNTTITRRTFAGTVDTGLTAYLFAQNYGGRAGNFCYAKIYSCKILMDGVTVRDFVPCYRKTDNVVGMYDLVTDTLFTNQGTGEFSYGNLII